MAFLLFFSPSFCTTNTQFYFPLSLFFIYSMHHILFINANVYQPFLPPSYDAYLKNVSQHFFSNDSLYFRTHFDTIYYPWPIDQYPESWYFLYLVEEHYCYLNSSLLLLSIKKHWFYSIISNNENVQAFQIYENIIK